MSSWGCQRGTYDARYAGVTCDTTLGATFPTDITLNLYRNPGGGVVGGVLATTTQTFNIPYRPSADSTCADPNNWKAADGNCYNGLATPITFTFTGVTLPASVIDGIAFNTTSSGYSPLGPDTACNSQYYLGCGYDSLNVSAASTTPRTGVDDDVNGAFQASSLTTAYCNGTPGPFRLDSPCWTGYNPMVKFVTRR